MKRSYLEKVYFKKKTPVSLIKFKKQKNYCSRLYKKERKKYFESLNSRSISDNKSFWKNIQPFFSEKRTISNEINLVENINKYRNHPSALLIKSRLKSIPSFSFNKVGLSEIEKELNLINPRKATTSNSIPPKLLKSTKTICYGTLKTIFNNCLIKAEFPNKLKLADVTPILKKEDPSRAKNYKPFSVLSRPIQAGKFIC